MKYDPKSNYLFITICSLNKSGGGSKEYNEKEFIANGWSKEIKSEIFDRREKIRKMVMQSKKLFWQGTELSTLEFNAHLFQGHDFGGSEPAL